MDPSKIRLLVLGTLLFLAVVMQCSEANAMELTDAGVKYQRFFDNNYTPYLDGAQREKLTLILDVDLLPTVYWWNRIEGVTDETQYRHIGWNFGLGLRLTPALSIGYEHHSQHALDRATPLGAHFPVEDSVGFTWHFILPKSGKSLFGGK